MPTDADILRTIQKGIPGSAMPAFDFLTDEQRKSLFIAAKREGDAEVTRDAQKRFFREHIAWWVPAFAMALRRKADDDNNFYGTLGRALAEFIAVERRLLDVAPPTELVEARQTEGTDSPECEGCDLKA